jgi:hypothetical protein
MRWSTNFCLILCLSLVGCSDVAPGKVIAPDLDQGQLSFDGQIVDTIDLDMVTPPAPMDMGTSVVEMDMGLDVDAAMMLADMEITAGRCDPRQMGNACDEGFFCRASSEFEGICVLGDGCSLVDNSGCNDPNNSQCNLIGRATLCGPAGTGITGDDCTGGVNGWLPCAEGYLCNGSICQAACDPTVDVCDDQSRCADVSGSLGQAAGLCVERNCNIYSGLGCGVTELCRFAVATDGVTVGTCRPAPMVLRGVGEACAYGVDDDCEQGLACVQAMNGDVCRQTCDSGGYQVRCPDTEVCIEALANTAGVIRGVGLCVTNL